MVTNSEAKSCHHQPKYEKVEIYLICIITNEGYDTTTHADAAKLESFHRSGRSLRLTLQLLILIKMLLFETTHLRFLVLDFCCSLLQRESSLVCCDII